MSLFLGNNRQYSLVYAKTISSWVRKVLCVAKAHMSPGSLWGVAVSTALAASVSLVSILQVDDWADFLHELDTIFPPTSLLQICTRILCSMLY